MIFLFNWKVCIVCGLTKLRRVASWSRHLHGVWKFSDGSAGRNLVMLVLDGFSQWLGGNLMYVLRICRDQHSNTAGVSTILQGADLLWLLSRSLIVENDSTNAIFWVFHVDYGHGSFSFVITRSRLCLPIFMWLLFMWLGRLTAWPM